jgi:hypothetical protein
MAGCYGEVRKGNRLWPQSCWPWGVSLDPVIAQLLVLGFGVAALLFVVICHVVLWVRQPVRQAHPAVGYDG